MFIRRLYLYIQKNSLLKNSLFLFSSNLLASGGGFLFWIVIARFYSTENVGIATALFSLSSLIASLSLLGLNTGLLKYLPSLYERDEKINTSILVIIAVTTLLTGATLLGLPVLSPSLLFVRENIFFSFLFISLTLSTTLNSLVDSIIIAYRASVHILIKTVIQIVIKLVLPIFTVFWGAFGIFIAFSFGTVSALIYSAIVVSAFYNVRYKFQFHISSIKTMAKVSFGTYTANLITSIPSFLIPLFIANRIGVKETAYYFIAATTANFLFLIPQVVTQNLLVESSYNQKEILFNTKKAMRLLSILLIPGVILVLLFGGWLLTVFGKEYSSEGLILLRLLALSSVFVGINYIFGILFIIYSELKLLIFTNSITTAVLLFLSFIFLQYGIVGVGYATLISQIALFILSIFSFYKTRKINLLKFVL